MEYTSWGSEAVELLLFLALTSSSNKVRLYLNEVWYGMRMVIYDNAKTNINILSYSLITNT